MRSRASLVLAGPLIALMMLSCGGAGGDEAELKDLMEDFFDALQDGDAERLAGLFSAECGDLTADAEAAIEQFQSVEGVEIDLDGVDVQDLTGETAAILPKGRISIEGQTQPLVGEDEEFTPVVKEDGEWKIAECQLFL